MLRLVPSKWIQWKQNFKDKLKKEKRGKKSILLIRFNNHYYDVKGNNWLIIFVIILQPYPVISFCFLPLYTLGMLFKMTLMSYHYAIVNSCLRKYIVNTFIPPVGSIKQSVQININAVSWQLLCHLCSQKKAFVDNTYLIR